MRSSSFLPGAEEGEEEALEVEEPRERAGVRA